MGETLRVLSEIQSDYREREQNMLFRHPWFNMVYNYFIAFIVLLLVISLLSWGRYTYRSYEEEKARNAENRARQEELARSMEEEAEAERQRQKEIYDMIDRWADAAAKSLYGIRNFTEKYHYSEKDWETYLRSQWNRYLSNNRLTDLEIIIFKEDQYLACYRTNPAFKEYKEFARELFTEWYTEDTVPCDPAYVYAELMPDGVFLTKIYGAGPYEKRWQAA